MRWRCPWSQSWPPWSTAAWGSRPSNARPSSAPSNRRWRPWRRRPAGCQASGSGTSRITGRWHMSSLTGWGCRRSRSSPVDRSPRSGAAWRSPPPTPSSSRSWSRPGSALSRASWRSTASCTSSSPGTLSPCPCTAATALGTPWTASTASSCRRPPPRGGSRSSGRRCRRSPRPFPCVSWRIPGMGRRRRSTSAPRSWLARAVCC
mmetsp:Transcript_146816/g.256380  ORF Transcript_146816/g.256380 Transcript_146816/m.256380 type:complete len:205 (-) Transcript_146816:31-645(-)